MIEITAVPSIEIKIDGKVRRLRYTNGAWVAFERELGLKSFAEVTGKFFREGDLVSAREMTALLWCGLLHEEPELTMSEVGSWFGVRQYQEIAKVILEALVGQMPEAEPGK